MFFVEVYVWLVRQVFSTYATLFKDFESFLNTQNLCFKLFQGILYCYFFFFFTCNFYQVLRKMQKYGLKHVIKLF